MGWYARFITNYPWVIIVIDVVIVLACGPVTFWLKGFPDFTDPYKGLEPRGTKIRGRDQANTRLMSGILNGTFTMLTPESVVWVLPPALQASTQSQTGGNTCLDEVIQGVSTTPVPPSLSSAQKSIVSSSLPRLVIEPKVSTDSLWSAEHMKSICKLEQRVISSKLPVTCSAHTLPYYISALQNTHCENIVSQDMENVLHLLKECSSYFFNDSLSPCVNSPGLCVNIPANCTKYNAVYYIFNYFTDVGFLQDGNIAKTHLSYSQVIFRRSWNISVDQFFDYFMDNIESKSIGDDLIDVPAYEMDRIFGRINSAYVVRDLPFYGLSLALVIIILFFYLRSVVLMAVVMLNVGNSIAVSYFIFYYVLQFKYFGFGNILAGLLLIAIGSDDVFIFHDIWHKLKQESPNPATVDIEDLVSKTIHHAFISILVTSLTTSAALFANIISELSILKTFGIFSGTCITVNLFFMTTLVPSVLILLEKFFRKYPSCCEWKWANSLTDAMHKLSSYFWGQIMSNIVVKGAIPLVIIFLGVGIYGFIAVFYNPQLKLPQSEKIQAFASRVPLEVYRFQLFDKFRFEIQHEEKSKIRLSLNFVFGIEGKDNGDIFNPDDTGYLKLDDSFTIYPKENQLWLKSFCRNLLNDELIYEPGRYKCFMDVFEEAVASNCSYPQYNITLSSPCCMSTFPLESSTAETCYKETLFLKLLHNLSNFSILIGAPVFDSNRKMFAVLYQVETKQTSSANYGIINTFFSRYEDFMDVQLKTVPKGLKNAWFTGSLGKELMFYDLQSSLLRGIVSGIGLSMAVAFVMMLITSGNFFITLYAIVTIIFVIVVTVAVFTFLGWELGVPEALTITLAVGLSIDFTIHLGIGYIVSPNPDRPMKVRDSVGMVGFAVFMAGFTTFVSGTALLPANVVSYSKFGTFLMINMSVSWLFSMFFFLSICTLIGPIGTFGQLSALFKPCKKLKKEDPTKEHNENVKRKTLRDVNEHVNYDFYNHYGVHPLHLNDEYVPQLDSQNDHSFSKEDRKVHNYSYNDYPNSYKQSRYDEYYVRGYPNDKKIPDFEYNGYSLDNRIYRNNNSSRYFRDNRPRLKRYNDYFPENRLQKEDFENLNMNSYRNNGYLTDGALYSSNNSRKQNIPYSNRHGYFNRYR